MSATVTSTASPPLRVDALVKRFGQVTAVDGISLELRRGECVGLLGPNGAVSLPKPNLESVFLHLTGRELRD